MRIAAAVGVVVVFLLAACSSSGKKASALDCQGETPSVEPTQLILACGDGAIRATDLRWSAWSGTSAKGTGFVAVNGCSPSCAVGSAEKFPAMFSLTKPVTVGNTTFLTELVIDFSAATPNGKREVQCRLSDPSAPGGCVNELTSR